MLARALLFFVALLFTFSTSATEVVDKHTYKVSEIIAGIQDSFYSTEGYVISIHKCPVCPEKALCKPCEGEFLQISENKSDTFIDIAESPNYLRLYTNPAQIYEPGKKYMFLVQVVKGYNGNNINSVTDFHEIPE